MIDELDASMSRHPAGRRRHLITPETVRAAVDTVYPRTLPDGQINPQHVAVEQTLRERHGLPSYVAGLDGPGKFRRPPLRIRVELARHDLHRLEERVWTGLAYLLPRKLAYWAAIRVMVHATTGDFSDQVVPELYAVEALERWHHTHTPEGTTR